jgi:hypothetical protein
MITKKFHVVLYALYEAKWKIQKQIMLKVAHIIRFSDYYITQ